MTNDERVVRALEIQARLLALTFRVDGMKADGGYGSEAFEIVADMVDIHADELKSIRKEIEAGR